MWFVNIIGGSSRAGRVLVDMQEDEGLLEGKRGFMPCQDLMAPVRMAAAAVWERRGPRLHEGYT